MSAISKLTAEDALWLLAWRADYFDDEDYINWSATFDGTNVVTVVAYSVDTDESKKWMVKLVP